MRLVQLNNIKPSLDGEQLCFEEGIETLNPRHHLKRIVQMWVHLESIEFQQTRSVFTCFSISWMKEFFGMVSTVFRDYNCCLEKFFYRVFIQLLSFWRDLTNEENHSKFQITIRWRLLSRMGEIQIPIKIMSKSWLYRMNDLAYSLLIHKFIIRYFIHL